MGVDLFYNQNYSRQHIELLNISPVFSHCQIWAESRFIIKLYATVSSILFGKANL